ncbi:MAG: aminotransferase family protein [Planctomycetota bacterium]|jgi:adenosylmethionine-8-amino-7-oxononanoate aminotransferase
MLSKDKLTEMDINSLLHPIATIRTHEEQGPRIIVEGEGCYVRDVDGKEYLDGFSSLWNVVVGHRRKAIADAVMEQMNKLEYFSPFYGFATPPAIELARKVLDLMPKEWDMGRVLFTCGGSETSDTNIKIARMYWSLKGKADKKKIISRNAAYHGQTMGALAATGIDIFKMHFEPISPGFVHIMAPFCYRCALDLTYPECGIGCAKQLEETILSEGPDTVAAFIGEPVIGAGGTIPPPDEYWPMIRDICDKYDVLLIDDEVITGFGRTGKMFGLMNWNVRPDQISMAKGITSGYIPLGAAAISNEIINTLREGLGDFPFLHAFTYNNHPVGCAAGLANIKIIEDEKLVENAAKVGEYLARRLQGFYDHKSVGNIRSLGLMGAVELVKDRETKERIDGTPLDGPHRIEELLWEKGVYLRAMGQCVSIAPPLSIIEEQIDTALDALDSAIVQMENEML